MTVLASQMFASGVSYSGPIPPPEMLRQYDEIVPGTAARLLEDAHKQTAHRIELEKKVITSDIRRSWTGLGAGTLVVLVCIVGGIWLVHNGHDGAGGTIATVSVVGLATAFIYGTTSKRHERQERAQTLTGKKR